MGWVGGWLDTDNRAISVQLNLTGTATGTELGKMQNYFKSNRHRISQEESQMILKMRIRETNVKMNYKGNYENLDCSVCNQENESQKHIIQCSEIKKHKNDMTKIIEYEKLFGENVRIQKEIFNCFMENMKIKSELEKIIEREETLNLLNPFSWGYFPKWTM